MNLRPLLASAVLLAAGCGGDAPPPAGTPSTPTPPPSPIMGPAGGALGRTYPFTTCVVTGETLGKMGPAVVVVREGVEIRLCCGDCEKDLDKDVAKYVGMVKAATK